MNPSTGQIENDWLLDRALGALVGACIGDASGASLERLGRFPSAGEVKAAMSLVANGSVASRTVTAGGVTDDGEMTISLANALAEMCRSSESDGAEARFDLETVARHYAKWVRTNPSDMGLTVGASVGVARSNQRSFLELVEAEGFAIQMQRGAAFEAKLAAASKSNGQLMRTAPLALFAHRLSDAELARLCKADCSLSHIAPACSDAATAYCVALSTLLRRQEATGSDAFDAARQWTDECAGDEVRGWMADIVRGDIVPAWPNAGFAKVAFSHALHRLRQFDSAQKVSDATWDDVLCAVLMAGGDTDTNACIAGALIGALVGFNRLPLSSRARVLGHQSNRPDFLAPVTLLDTVPAIIRRAPTRL
jgi:ADP-ribosyl-[dinitrogen reductase] hydrolase